jgi:predicted CoA-binding protein
MLDTEKLRQILAKNHTIAVVGLSAKQDRPSYIVAKYMQDHGYRIIPVNPSYSEVLGETCYPRLSDIPDQVDMVDIFQRAELVSPIVEEAITIAAKVVWMQMGIVDEVAAARASAAGLAVVMDRCLMVEHARLRAGQNFSS